MGPKDKFHSPLYKNHNDARFNHFRTLGLPVEGKSVLELGAGIGDHTDFLFSLGVANIQCVEARDENIAILKDRFGTTDNISIVKMDMENPIALESKFDLVYSYGLLYHLNNPKVALKWMSEHANGYLIMETCVSVSEENEVIYVDEDQGNVTQSFSGKGCRPSRKWIMQSLKELFPYQYISVTQPVHPEFPVDWKNISNEKQLTRAIFVGSNINFDDNAKLSAEIPGKHLTA